MASSLYDRPIAEVAERRMRQWALRLEAEERALLQRARRAEGTDALTERIHPYLAISREAGAGGRDVARAVAERMRWELHDKDLLDHMAQRFHLQRNQLDSVDETSINWLLELFGKWVSQRVVTQSEYVAHLGQTLLMAAHHGPGVFLGRGAGYLLPRERGLHVLVVAERKSRVGRIQQRLGIGADEAERHVDRADQDRRDFVQQYFHRDVADAELYDLSLNTGRLGIEEAADTIVGLLRRRFPES